MDILHWLNQVLATQVTRDERVHVNPNANTTTLRIRNFTRMDPSTFYGSNIEEDPQGFINELFKVFVAISVCSQEKEELVAY